MAGERTIEVDGREYELLVEITNDSYEWHTGCLMRGPDGLYFAETSGCSCYSFDDVVSVDDIHPVTSWHAAVELAKDSFPEAEVADFAAACMRAER